MHHPSFHQFLMLCTLCALTFVAAPSLAQQSMPYIKRALSPETGQVSVLYGPAHPSNLQLLTHGARLQRTAYRGDVQTRQNWSNALGLETGLYKTLSAGIALQVIGKEVQDPLLYLNFQWDADQRQCMGSVATELRFATEEEKSLGEWELEYYNRAYNYRSTIHCRWILGERHRLDVAVGLNTTLLTQNWEVEGFKTFWPINAMFTTQLSDAWFAGLSAQTNVTLERGGFKTGLAVQTGYTLPHLLEVLPSLDLTAQIGMPFLLYPGLADEDSGEVSQHRTAVVTFQLGFNAHFDFTPDPAQ